MRIAVGTAHILVEECLFHKFRDARVPFVGQRIFPYSVSTFRRYHFFQEFLVGFRRTFHHAAVFEPQLDTGDFIAVAIERLIETYPTIRTAPVGRSENLETRNVPTASCVPVPLLP